MLLLQQFIYIWTYPRNAYASQEELREMKEEQRYSTLAESKHLLYILPL